MAALAGIGTSSPWARTSAAEIARPAITSAIAERYPADPRTSVIGEEPAATARAAAASASAAPSEPMSAASASGTRRIVGASAVIATRASAIDPPSSRTTAVTPTTAISI